jgi:hypothetical protein
MHCTALGKPWGQTEDTAVGSYDSSLRPALSQDGSLPDAATPMQQCSRTQQNCIYNFNLIIDQTYWHTPELRRQYSLPSKLLRRRSSLLPMPTLARVSHKK